MIRINEELYIDVDDYNYTVFRPMKCIDKKTGKLKRKPVGYYGNMRDTLKAIVESELTKSITTDDEISLSDALERMNKAYRKIEEQIKSAVPDPDVYKVV